VAANIPDGDVLLSLAGRDTYLFADRGASHSLIGLAVLALALAASFRMFSPLKQLPILVALAAAGLAVHTGLDLVTPWGARLFWPFDARRIALNWLAEVDPVVWALLGGGLVAGLVWTGRSAGCNRTALALVLAYTLAGAVSQSLAVAQFTVSLGTIRVRPERLEAFPQMLRPLEWNVVGWTPDRYFEGEVHALTGMHGRLRAWFRIPVPAPVDGAFVRSYLDWARAPLVKLQNGAGTSVALYDLAWLGRAEGMPYVVAVTAGPAPGAPVHAWQGPNIAPPSPDEERELRAP